MRLISSAPRPHVTRRRYRLSSHAITAPMAIIASAASSTVAMRPPSATWVFDTVTPAATSAITSPSSPNTGTTARTEGPSVPVYVSVNASPASARSMLPRNSSPIWSGSRCV